MNKKTIAIKYDKEKNEVILEKSDFEKLGYYPSELILNEQERDFLKLYLEAELEQDMISKTTKKVFNQILIKLNQED